MRTDHYINKMSIRNSSYIPCEGAPTRDFAMSCHENNPRSYLSIFDLDSYPPPCKGKHYPTIFDGHFCIWRGHLTQAQFHELQVLGTIVSEPTISRALHQSGFTLKKVSATCFWGLLITHIHLIAYSGSTGAE